MQTISGCKDNSKIQSKNEELTYKSGGTGGAFKDSFDDDCIVSFSDEEDDE